MRHPVRLATLLGLALLLAAGSLVPVAAAPEPDAGAAIETVILASGAEAVAGEVLVKCHGASILDAAAMRPAAREGWHVVTLKPGQAIEAATAHIAGTGSVAAVEPNYVYRLDSGEAVAVRTSSVGPASHPNDPLYGEQWHLRQIQTAEAWHQATGAGVTVAVIDSGVSAIPEFGPGRLLQGIDLIDPAGDASDALGHGTHVAGTIAQATNNAVGVAGVAYNASVLPVRVLDADGFGTASGLAAGLRAARDAGAQVINLSLGSPYNSSLVAEEVADTLAAGIPIIAAMGNSGSEKLSYPAALPGVIAVGSVRYDESRAYYSSYGAHTWIVAPGGDLRVNQSGSDLPDGVLQATIGDRCDPGQTMAFCLMQGTSMAAPHVTGVIALMLEKNPGLSVDEIREILASTARDLGPAGRDAEYGHGLVQAEAAVAAATSATSTPNPGSFGNATYLPVGLRAGLTW